MSMVNCIDCGLLIDSDEGLASSDILQDIPLCDDCIEAFNESSLPYQMIKAVALKKKFEKWLNKSVRSIA